ncbi:hypothetical protein BAE44_0017094 [Dichanthelium oligosanthes]|uniref:Uncharacterized protein n=1 Tax=Dichanthelium oligosanthes TaxID=888268 RepID=A0A1E5V9Z6_9POAL|nr:hypothetical protein BAE44_0017094 [Dichanthelium oligosanthes]
MVAIGAVESDCRDQLSVLQHLTYCLSSEMERAHYQHTCGMDAGPDEEINCGVDSTFGNELGRPGPSFLLGRMAALVDLDLNCRPPSPEPEPAVSEEPRRAMLRQYQSFPDQVKDLHKFYGSFWKQSSSTQSTLHSPHEHTPMNLGLRANQNQEAFTNSNKRKLLSDIVEQSSDVRTSFRIKSDAYHSVIDLEKPTTSGDAVETVGFSGFGNLANQNGSVGSSDTPDCQSPIKTSNTESRHSLIDLNVAQEEGLIVSSALFHSSSTYPGKFSRNPREVSEAECGSGIGSMRRSSATVITPNSVSDSSRDVVAGSSVQRKGLFDLNVSLESIDMPSEIISNYRDKVVNNNVSKETAPNHSFSTKNSLQEETSRKYLTHGNDHMLASKDDSGINKIQSLEPGTINREFLIPESHLVDNNPPPRIGISHNGASNYLEVNMLQDKVDDYDTTASIAATTLLSIYWHNSARTADCPGSSSETAAQNGNNEAQPSLDSFEKIVLSLEEIKDDGQSIDVTPPNKDGPACGIKLKRGRGMRNFQREIIPGLVSLARQEICEDLEAIGYEAKKTRSRKTRKGQGASSTRSRLRMRGSAARN